MFESIYLSIYSGRRLQYVQFIWEQSLIEDAVLTIIISFLGVF